MIIFEEHAKRTHPETSHIRAEKLTKTPKLTRRVICVLEMMSRHAGYTARELGDVLFHQTTSGRDTGLERSTWPHKNMSKLVAVGWVKREHHDNGLRCFITETGKEILRGKKKC